MRDMMKPAASKSFELVKEGRTYGFRNLATGQIDHSGWVNLRDAKEWLWITFGETLT